ncbi:MAG TPA: hypothetical protein VKT76_06775 [Bradyrhizobium sp.]|nr:hypothetical protein [Bradyrhizobium sp.]
MASLYRRAPLAVSIFLVGCANTQLNYNTLDIASTYDQLITKQVSYNIRKSLASKYGLPAFVKVTAGTATTQNSITPTGSIPISTGITNQIQTAATGLLTSDSRSTARAAPGLTIAANDQWSQTYTLTPVTDTDQLRRLRALYQYVTRQFPAGAEGDRQFECEYPLIEASSSGGSGGTQTTLTVMVDNKPVKITMDTAAQKPDDGKPIYVRRAYSLNPDGSFKAYTWIQVSPDTTFIKTPGCILCDYGNGLNPDDLDLVKKNNSLDPLLTKTKNIHKLEKSFALRSDWLVLPEDGIQSDTVALPSNGDGTIYVKGEYEKDPQYGLKYFYEFALLTEDASSQGTGSPASGGQSLGRKTPNVERISVPVAAGTTPSP